LTRPISEEDLIFVTAVFADSHKFTTVPLFLSAAARYGRQRWGADFLLPRGPAFEAAFTGMRHFYGPSTVSTPKAALTLSNLRAFAPLLDLSVYEDARDWCAFLFAFFALLRINEYANAGLRHAHVQRTEGGLDITIVSSKTEQHPVTVSIARRGDVLCPASALFYLHSAVESNNLPSGPNDPLFLSRLEGGPGAHRFEPTTAEEFIQRLRFYIAATLPGADPSRYAGHSFRRGGATSMLLAGVQPAVIQRHGRWRSDTWRRYIDSHDNPTVRLIATRSLNS
jgi:hypothetical protein